MTVSSHYSAAWLVGTGTAKNTLLHVKGGSITRDEAFAPYIRGTLVIAMPDQATLEALDPRKTPTPPQLILSAWSRYDANPIGQQRGAPLNDVEIPGSTLGMYVWLRSRTIDHAANEVTITYGGTETLLQDYRLMSKTPVSMESSSVLTAMKYVWDMVPVGYWTAADIGTVAPGATTLVRTNLCTNPSFETNANAWGLNSVTLTRVSAANGIARGAWCGRVMPNGSNNDSSIQLDGYLAAGKTYTVSAWVGQDAPLVDALHARALKIIAFVKPTAAGAYVEYSSSQKANAAGKERLSVTFTVPAGVSDSIVRIYHGGLNGASQKPIYVDAVLVEETSFLRSYIDGSRVNQPGSTYAWTGTAHASTSTATEVASAGDVATDWQPGQTAWDFLEPLLTAARMRYYSDEFNVWRKADADYSVPGSVRIAAGWNLTSADDDISRKADSDWCDAVMVKYTWTDAAGATQVAYDQAGSLGAKKVKLVEIAAGYPGPGAAAYILNRSQGRGRVLRLGAISDYSVKPGQEVVATLPSSPISTGYISAVTFDLATDEMQIVSRQLTDTSPDAWLLAPIARTWDSIAAGVTWNTYTN